MKSEASEREHADALAALQSEIEVARSDAGKEAALVTATMMETAKEEHGVALAALQAAVDEKQAAIMAGEAKVAELEAEPALGECTWATERLRIQRLRSLSVRHAPSDEKEDQADQEDQEEDQEGCRRGCHAGKLCCVAVARASRSGDSSG